MNTFDPVAVRKAVAEFAPRRPQKFQDLAPAREVIVELRQKRASYRSIAELLTEHCLPISKTAIAAYCHEVLGERVRPKRRATARKHGATPAPPAMLSEFPPPLSLVSGSTEQPGDSKETNPSRSRGPRIAQVRMVNQTEK
jgi:hypothetical protein